MSDGMTIRENFEKRENNFMSPFGCQSAHSKGREKAEGVSPIRTAFQVDRDRIVYSNAFRRLKHKTQVFLRPLGDEYRTRLTHTLEVAQIARTIARAMFLYDNVYRAPLVHNEFVKAKKILSELYAYFLDHEALLEQELAGMDMGGIYQNGDSRERIVCDVIASMTDRYAMALYERIFFPSPQV